MTSLYRYDIILVSFKRIIGKDYKKKIFSHWRLEPVFHAIQGKDLRILHMDTPFNVKISIFARARRHDSNEGLWCCLRSYTIQSRFNSNALNFYACICNPAVSICYRLIRIGCVTQMVLTISTINVFLIVKVEKMDTDQYLVGSGSVKIPFRKAGRGDWIEYVFDW